jgi:hypothetical protein
MQGEVEVGGVSWSSNRPWGAVTDGPTSGKARAAVLAILCAAA